MLALSGCCLLGAAMAKTEGVLFALVVLAAQLVFHRAAWRAVAGLAALVLGPTLAWRAVVVGINPHPASDVDLGGALELLELHGARVRRFARSAGDLVGYAAPLVLGTVAVLGTTRVPDARSRAAEVWRLIVLALASWMMVLGLAAVYAAGGAELGYWLRQSAERVVATPILLAFVVTAEALLLVGVPAKADRYSRSS